MSSLEMILKCRDGYGAIFFEGQQGGGDPCDLAARLYLTQHVFDVHFLFAAFMFYIQQQRFPGFAGLVSLGAVTLVYAVNAVVVYAMLYGKKPNPYETHEGRVQTIGLSVKSSIYSCIACVAFLSLNFTLVLLDLQRWEPFAQSVFFVVCAFICLMGLAPPPHRPGQGPAPAGD